MINSVLEKSRYLCSNDEITEADIRLFPTLIRQDEVYSVYFKTNHVPLVGSSKFPAIVRYMKDLMAVQEIRSTVIMKHIKTHYFTSHEKLNPFWNRSPWCGRNERVVRCLR